MKEQLLDTWHINQQMNLLLFNNISVDGFQKTLSSRGGRTIFQQWIHIHNVRIQWLEICAKDISSNYTILNKEMPFDKNLLLNALEESTDGVSQLLGRGWDNGGKVNGFKKGVIPLLGYFISHESHHRGNMLLTLKQVGEKIPDIVKWGLWEWGK